MGETDDGQTDKVNTVALVDVQYNHVADWTDCRPDGPLHHLSRFDRRRAADHRHHGHPSRWIVIALYRHPHRCRFCASIRCPCRLCPHLSYLYRIP